MKPVATKELKERMLNTTEARAAYEDADRELRVLEALHAMRESAGLSKAELAKRLEIAPSAINRLEKNPMGASLKTLERYARACNASWNFNVVYK